MSTASTWYDTVNANTPDDEAEFCDCGFPDTECTFPDCDAGKETEEERLSHYDSDEARRGEQ